MVRVKICGITDVRDARAAARLGADALGFNFCRESPRYIRPERAKAIIAALPPLLTMVGVFVNEDPDTIMEICRLAGLDAAQLHGDESPSVVDAVRGVRRIKAIRVASEEDVRLCRRYRVEAFLLDASVPGAARRHGADVRLEPRARGGAVRPDHPRRRPDARERRRGHRRSRTPTAWTSPPASSPSRAKRTAASWRSSSCGPRWPDAASPAFSQAARGQFDHAPALRSFPLCGTGEEECAPLSINEEYCVVNAEWRRDAPHSTLSTQYSSLAVCGAPQVG